MNFDKKFKQLILTKLRIKPHKLTVLHTLDNKLETQHGLYIPF